MIFDSVKSLIGLLLTKVAKPSILKLVQKPIDNIRAERIEEWERQFR